jgi:Lar family restriction alleviation protein
MSAIPVPKPCPFCASQTLVIEMTQSLEGRIQCSQCKARGPMGTDLDSIVEAWNTRAMLRPALERFANLMEATLKENDHKGGWEHMTNDAIMGRIIDEALELQTAITEIRHMRHDAAEYREGCRKAAKEASDVANFAMMLADNVTRLQSVY